MRRTGNPWEFLVALVAVGLVLQAIGEGPFLALMWVGVGIYAVVALWPLFAGLFQALGWIAARVGDDAGTNSAEVARVYDHPYWDAYLAVSRRDLREVRRLVETRGVDPFAPFPAHIKPSCSSRTLYGYAREMGNAEAEAYFNAWRLERTKAALAR